MSDGTCPTCGGPATRQYCSRPCADIGRRKSERVQVQCPCGTRFETTGNLIASGRGTYCSKPCMYAYRTRPTGLTYNVVKDNPTKFRPGNVPWQAGTTGLLTAWNKGLTGIHLSPATEFQPGEQSGAANARWAGDDVGYSGLHIRVRKERGPAADYPCEWADETCKGPMHWANVSHEYQGVSDFIPLCQSHHFRYDKVGHHR